jgi:hypothetical protein
MSEVTTLAELAEIDGDQALAGYRDGLGGRMVVERHKDRSYTHGYLNGLVDSGKTRPSDAQRQLAREFLKAAA